MALERANGQGIYLKGGTIIDGRGNQPYTASVLIQADQITGIGEEADTAAIESGAEVVDVAGLTVMPGLIDAHCHITLDEPHSNDEMFFHRREGLGALVAAYNVRKLLLAGVTGFFDADCIFDLGIDLRDAIEANLVDGPRMATGGNALLTSVGGTAGRLIPEEGRRGYAKVVRNRDEIVTEVRRQIKAGVDWIKVHVTGLIPRQKEQGEISVWTADELKAVCDTAHDLGTRVVGHCRNAKSARDAANAGFDMILHATNMDEEALEAVVDAKVPLVPTLTFQANLADFGQNVGADPGLQEIFRREIIDSSEMLRRAYDAGVPLICGTESGFSLTPYGEWHHRELEVFVEHLGMTPLEAIACSTSVGAYSLRLEGQVGAIDKNQLADVIVVDGDPAKDVSILGDRRRLRHVIAAGRPVELDRPQPERKALSGWQVSPYSTSKLTQAAAKGEFDQ